MKKWMEKREKVINKSTVHAFVRKRSYQTHSCANLLLCHYGGKPSFRTFKKKKRKMAAVKTHSRK